MMSHCCTDLWFPNGVWHWAYFCILCISSLARCLSVSFTYFEWGGLCLRCLCIWDKSFIRYVFASTFLPASVLSLDFLKDDFHRVEIFSCLKSMILTCSFFVDFLFVLWVKIQSSWSMKQNTRSCKIGSVQFSRSVVSDSVWPHGLQHASSPRPSPSPGVYSNSCPLSRWCPPTISFSVVPFSSHLQSFPASGSFQMSQFFTSGGQSIGVSTLASVLPMNIQDWFPLEWTGWIFLQSKGLSRVFSNTTVQKHQFFGSQLSSQSNSHIHTWLLEKQ